MSRELLQRVLKVLKVKRLRLDEHIIPIIVEEIEAELAKPEQEPVKCTCGYSIGHPLVSSCSCKPRKEWVGLTDDEHSEIYNDLYTQYTRDDVNIADFILIARAIEAQLKDKDNG